MSGHNCVMLKNGRILPGSSTRPTPVNYPTFEKRQIPMDEFMGYTVYYNDSGS